MQYQVWDDWLVVLRWLIGCLMSHEQYFNYDQNKLKNNRSCKRKCCTAMSLSSTVFRGRVRFKTTYEISALSPLTLWVRILPRKGILDTILCDKVCLWQVSGFLQVFWFPPPIKVSATIKLNIVESGVKYNNPHPTVYHWMIWM